MKRIAFVCTGNTCRSPMAEAILKQKLKEAGVKNVQVGSAGLYPNVGEPMSENARRALKELGIKQTYHKARFADRDFMKRYDLVLTMTPQQKEQVAPFCREAYTINEYTGVGDVIDPYGGDLATYLATARQLERAAEAVVRKLSHETGA